MIETHGHGILSLYGSGTQRREESRRNLPGDVNFERLRAPGVPRCCPRARQRGIARHPEVASPCNEPAIAHSFLPCFSLPPLLRPTTHLFHGPTHSTGDDPCFERNSIAVLPFDHLSSRSIRISRGEKEAGEGRNGKKIETRRGKEKGRGKDNCRG